jgi:S-formylglutathione hydrolase FrmB
MKYSFLLVRVTLFLCHLIGYTTSDAPNFVSGCGLTVLSSTQLNTQLYEVVVLSKQVRGNQTIRILVPNDYATSGTSRHYPVLYLLHGSSGGAADWTTVGKAQNITSNASLISVMPNGDPFAFYTNWVIPSPSDVPQNWGTFHMEELVPWIDLNLRTVAKKEGRSIGGLSMGGYGSIHYAELYSDNFIYAASFSGALDLLDPLVQEEIINLPGTGVPFLGPFGDPSAPIGSNGFFAESTLTRAAELRNITLAIYTGGEESRLREGSYRLRDLLNVFNIPFYFDDYGNGQSIGHGCDGTHSWFCWNAALIDVLPRMMAVLQQQY